MKVDGQLIDLNRKVKWNIIKCWTDWLSCDIMWPLTYGDFAWAEVVNSWWTKQASVEWYGGDVKQVYIK